MARRAIGFRLDEDLVARVDWVRGDVSRTRFVERAIAFSVDALEGTLKDMPEARSVSEVRAEALVEAHEARREVAAPKPKRSSQEGLLCKKCEAGIIQRGRCSKCHTVPKSS